MTNISCHKRGKTFQMVAIGHSGYAEYDKDIVCSAISVLTYTFMDMCLNYFADDKVVVKRSKLEDGLAEIVVEDAGGILSSAIDMLRIGFESIEEQYPSNVSLEWVES